MPSSSTISIEEEMRKNPELKEDDLQHLREWNSKQPHLPTIPDDQLILFLHSCYWSLERAKKTIDACFTIRTHSPELFSRRDPLLPEMQSMWEVMDIVLLPERDPDGNIVVLTRLGITDPSKFVHADGLKVFLLAMDAVLTDGTQPGFRFIQDVGGITLGHVYKLNMPVLRKCMVYIQEGLRVRMKSIHIINHSPLIDRVMTLVQPMMKEEMTQQMKFHSSMEDLYKVIPQRILPNEYGGQAGSVSSLKEALKKRMEANRERFLEDEKLVVDESKRRGSSVNAADLFGMEGSFKKLDID
ncbi:alpha-tocopherol transfer protein-like [Anabrus simplex]|uniref:alpha-tocopherol transfer protein-like n=1 Tax=Anabrus simplex TaxID=316456 RepID=UPI0035A29733